MLHLAVHPIDQFLGQLLASPHTPSERRVVERLLYLLAAYREEQDGASYSLTSARGLLVFLRLSPSLAYPSITVTPEGMLYATWKREPAHVFSAEFMDENQVRFVVIQPIKGQISGTTTVTNLPAAVTRLQVLDWASA